MFDFDKEINRRNNNSYKWNCKDNELPMWVADMDFDTAPKIKEAIIKRASDGALGYSKTPDELYNSYINFWLRRHHVKFEKEWMIFSIGVVPSISSIVRSITNVGDNVLISSPVYNIFYNSIINNKRLVLSSDLVYENGNYHLDFTDLENKMKDEKTTLMILCNPHNPVGKIWSKEELAKIGFLANKYHVVVLSDEIHCDIVDPGYEYVAFASVNEECANNSITTIAPSKCFNIAGLQSSMIVCKNKEIRKKVESGLNTDECAEGNAFSIDPIIKAFNESEDWLNELNVYLAENKRIFKEYLEKEIPLLHLVPSHATYLLWVDVSKITNDAKDLCAFIRKETGLWITAGEVYGGNGKSFFRINLATQRKNVIDGMHRLKQGIELYKKK